MDIKLVDTQPVDVNSLDSWLKWLETLHTKKIDLSLERVRVVADRMALLPHTDAFRHRYPDYQPKTIIVAGTNGKGSCVASLAALAHSTSINCGAYTSPHLLCYNERIRINGQQASDKKILQAFKAINAARLEQYAVSLSYFEFATLAALYLFCEQKLDLWILEVGLGGRLDATNIINADLAIITSIALDHQSFLGDDINSIAREKAGVMRAGQQLVIADSNSPAVLVDQARKLMTDYIMPGAGYDLCAPNTLAIEGQEYFFNPLLPEQSVAAAVVGFDKLFADSNDNIAKLIATAQAVQLPGRFTVMQRVDMNSAGDMAESDGSQNGEPANGEEKNNTQAMRYRMQAFNSEGEKSLSEHPTIVMDVAHNPASCAKLAEQLRRFIGNRKVRVLALFGMLADKDRLGALSTLIGTVDHFIPCSLKHTPRAAAQSLLVQDLKQLAVPDDHIQTSSEDLSCNLDTLLGGHASNDLIVIFGSFYSVAEAVEYMVQNSITLKDPFV